MLAYISGVLELNQAGQTVGSDSHLFQGEGYEEDGKFEHPPGSWQDGISAMMGGSKAITLGRSRCSKARTSQVVVMSAPIQKQREVETETAGRRAILMSTLMVAGSLLPVGRSEAAIQKIEGRERETQDAVTRGVREPSNLSAAKSNRVQEAAKTNTQASGGLILGAPKDTPAGAYRASQTSDETTTEPGVTKISSPTNLLRKRALESGG